MVKCAMCKFEDNNSLTLLQHVVRRHKNNPSFSVKCQFEGCGSTYRRWHSYKQHLRRKHPGEVPLEYLQENVHGGDIQHQDENPLQDINPLQDNNPPEDLNVPEDDNNDIEPQFVSAQDLFMWRTGKFLALLREEGNISQNAVNIVIEEVNDILQSYLDTVQVELMAACGGQESLSLGDMDRVFSDMKAKGLFEGVSSKFLLDKFLSANGKVEPHALYLGEESVWTQSTPPRIIQKKVHAYILPLKATIEQLLSHPEVLNYVISPIENTNDGVFRDIKDGLYFKAHRVFSSDQTALIIIFYYDDLQTSNVLGPKKHKFSMFYWTLGNVPPHLRSSLRAVNLYAIVRTKHLKKYGFGKVLSSFIDDIKELEGEGIKFVVKPHQEIIFRGALLFVTADTPAAQALGGFKESVGCAGSPCRNCDADQDTMQEFFTESAFTLRSKETHNERVRTVSDPTLSKEAASYWSKKYGINGESVFAALQDFDVTQCFVQDFMHVVLEGVLPLEIQEFLKFVVREKNLVTLKKLNHLIVSFNLGHLKRDQPSAIDDAHLDNALREHSLQCLALGHVLPFLLKNSVESDSEALDRLNNLVLLLQICNLALSYEFTEDDVTVLEQMILKHHSLFQMFYGQVKLTPKCHFMVHFPRHLMQFGSLRYQWCLRFEGGHAYFKRLMSIVLSYKNPCFTMVSRHSAKRAVQLLCFPGHDVSNFLDLGHKVGKGSALPVMVHPQRDLIRNALPTLSINDSVMKANFIVVNGTRYTEKSVILTRLPPQDFPSFGCVVEIVVHEEETLLLFRPSRTLYFESTLNAYRVLEDRDLSYRCILVRDLPFPHPLSLWRSGKEDYIVLFNAVPEFFG